jgi:hypothetical protein
MGQVIDRHGGLPAAGGSGQENRGRHAEKFPLLRRQVKREIEFTAGVEQDSFPFLFVQQEPFLRAGFVLDAGRNRLLGEVGVVELFQFNIGSLRGAESGEGEERRAVRQNGAGPGVHLVMQNDGPDVNQAQGLTLIPGVLSESHQQPVASSDTALEDGLAGKPAQFLDLQASVPQTVLQVFEGLAIDRPLFSGRLQQGSFDGLAD